jgi:CRP/FNR family transcriptional regulator, nitrogen fixation regulation protein
MGVTKLYAKAEKIFRAGKPARHIYKVESGCVRTYATGKGGRIVSDFYFDGDYFGLEMRDKHAVSADAVAASTIRVIGRRAIATRIATDIAVAKHMLAITNAELQRTQAHGLLLRSAAHERVANFLFEMKKRNRRKEVYLLMSRRDIADHLNLTIESVSRALARLKKGSVISFLSHRRVAVHIRKRLAAAEASL